MKLKLSNRIRRILALVIGVPLAVLLILRIFFGVDIFDRSGWDVGEDGSRRYLDYHGDALLGWQEIEGMTYYFLPDAGGNMATGWLRLEEGTLYLDEQGQRICGWAEINGDRYRFDSDGHLHTGWLQEEEGTYYLDAGGAMVTGWQEIGEDTYFFREDGLVHTGRLDTEDGRYWLAGDGRTQSGWVDTDMGRVRLDDEGKVMSGWLEEDGKTLYLTEDGLLHTGWLELDGRRYYFHPDGSMAVGRVEIDGVANYFSSKGMYFVMVNPWNKVPEDYTVELVEFYDGYLVAAECLEELTALREACLAAGLTFNLTSAYRSFEYQTTLFQRKVDKLMGQGYSRSAAERETGLSIAIPGTSEHQLGLAVDVKSGSRVYDWLAEHSWEYGFIVRYPEGTTHLTGIYYEPWHLRYVGRELAEELYTLDICVEAYINMLTDGAEKAQ